MSNLFSKIFGDDEAPETVVVVPVDPATDGVLGTTHLTPIMESLLALAVAVEHASGDGFSLADGLDLMKPAIKAARALKHYDAAKDEILDVTPHEADVLADKIALGLGGLRNADVARLATALANLAPGFLDVIGAIKDLRGGVLDGDAAKA